MARFPPPHLYAILDLEASTARGLTPEGLIDAWLGAGIRLVQLRAKSLSFGPMLALAERLAARCAEAGATFVVNDRADVARLCGADGVHVGQDDLSPDEARLVMPDARVIGLSTHTEAQLVAGLESAATYLAIGPVFQTGTKANPDPVVGVEGVRRAAIRTHEAGRPLVAIGGITLATAPLALEAGADAVAVVSDLLIGPPDVRAREYLRALEDAGE